KRPESHRQPCRATTAVLVSPSPTPIAPRKATRRRLDPTSSDLTPRPNPHRARGTEGAPSSRDFVPWRFSDAGRPSASKLALAGVRKPAQQRTPFGPNGTLGAVQSGRLIVPPQNCRAARSTVLVGHRPRILPCMDRGRSAPERYAASSINSIT